MNLIQTEQVVDTAYLLKMFDIEEIEDVTEGEVIPVCAGEWRKEPDGRWRFFECEDWTIA